MLDAFEEIYSRNLRKIFIINRGNKRRMLATLTTCRRLVTT